MARAKRKSKKSNRGNSGGFLPEGARTFLRERAVDMAGLALIVLALAGTLALLSYHAADPSLNTAGSDPVQNWLGRMGASFADLSLQTLGLASGLLIISLLGWGTRMWRHRQIEAIWYRLASLPVALLLATLFLGCFPAPDSWPLRPGLGGISGDILLGRLQPALAGIQPFDLPIIGCSAFLLAAAFFIPASGLGREEWGQLGRGVAGIVAFFTGAAAFLVRQGAQLLRFIGIESHGVVSEIPAPRLRLPKVSLRRAEKNEDEPPRRATIRQEPSLLGKAPAEEDAPEDPVLNVPNPANQASRNSKLELITPRTTRKSDKATAPQQGRLKLGGEDDFQLPPVDIFAQPDPSDQAQMNPDALKQNAQLLENVLQDFGVEGTIVKVRPGPVVTLYELEPAPGIKSSRVIGLADDIARSMSAVSVRVAVVPGRNVIGIELPNKKRQTVYIRELVESEDYEKTKSQLPLILGKDIGGVPVITDLARMPHLLIAGTTGSGKSVGINTMIMSLVYHLKPEQCRMIMVDPKMLELSIYDGIPHLLAPVVTDPKKAVVALKWAVREMENRYRDMSKLGVRNIEGYNQRVSEARRKGEVLNRRVQTGFDADTGKPVYEDQPLELKALPYIVVIVDEMADLMLVAGKDIEAAIQRLAQMARAAGIHLIMATQRPSVDVITGTVKANFPTRISFQVTSKIDSRTILGEQGAETLLGRGDMLYMAGGGRITRVHGPFVSDNEVEEVVKFLKSQGEPLYNEDVTVDVGSGGAGDLGGGGGDEVDELYQQAVEAVLSEGKVSTSFVQRRLQIGYNRAARIVEKMEEDGVVTPANGAGRREVVNG